MNDKSDRPSEVAQKWQSYQLERPVEETVLYEKASEHVAQVILNRPEKHNSFYVNEMAFELVRKLEMAVHDPDVKVIILKGNGTSFCTGDDLNRAPFEAFGGRPGTKLPQRNRLVGFTDLYNCLKAVAYCRKNIVAQAKGLTIGLGMRLLMGADVVVAGESAQFSQREQRIGFGGFLGNPLLMLHIGPKRTREWLLSGRVLNAEEAKDWGLVNAVVPDDKLEEETLRWANGIALHSADGLMMGKMYTQEMYDQLGITGMFTSGSVMHTLFTNYVLGEDEFNFLKVRTQVGASEAFRKREARWAEYGF